MPPELLKIDSTPADTMATVIRWPGHRITLDGSAAIANGIFLQMERQFDAGVNLHEVSQALLADEAGLLQLLGVEESEG